MLNVDKAEVFWGPDPASLPVVTKDELAAKVAGEPQQQTPTLHPASSHAPLLPPGGAKLLVLDGFVLDVDLFAAQHPGGAGLVKTELGNDITVRAPPSPGLPRSSLLALCLPPLTPTLLPGQVQGRVVPPQQRGAQSGADAPRGARGWLLAVAESAHVS